MSRSAGECVFIPELASKFNLSLPVCSINNATILDFGSPGDLNVNTDLYALTDYWDFCNVNCGKALLLKDQQRDKN